MKMRALAPFRSFDLTLVLIGANNTVKKRLDVATKTLAAWLNNRVFGVGIH